MAGATGIYIRDGRIQAARVEGSLRRPLLRSLVTRRFEDEEGSLAVLLEEGGISRRRVHLALPSRLVSFRKVVLPLKGEEQIRRTVKFQAERLVPGLDPEEAAVDFFVTLRGEDFTEIILAVARKRDIAACREKLDAAGIVPEGITVDLAATFNLLAAAGVLAEAPLVMAVDFGPESIHLLLAREGRLVQVRKLTWGELPRLPARLAGEIAYTVKTVGEEGLPDKVILAGRLPESVVVEALERELECPVESFDPLRYLSYTGELDIQGLLKESPVAPGAALAGLGRCALPLDFKGAERKVKSGYERLRRPLLAAALLLVCWVALQLLAAMGRAGAARAWLARLEGGAKAQYERVVGKGTPAFSRRDFHKKLAALARRRRQEGGGEGGWRGFFEFLRILSGLLPLDEKTVITTVNFQGDKASLRGEADDVEAIERLAQVLAESGRFQVRAPLRKRSRGGARRRKPFTFTIEFSPRSK